MKILPHNDRCEEVPETAVLHGFQNKAGLGSGSGWLWKFIPVEYISFATA